MRYRDRELMSLMAKELVPMLPLFAASDIAFFLSSYARLQLQNAFLFNIFAREVARKVHDFTPRELSEVVYAYAVAQFHPPLMFDVIRKRMFEVARHMEPWHLTLVVNGYARLGLLDTRLFALLATEISRQIGAFPARPLALIANAYARLRIENRFLLEVLGDEIFRKRADLSPQGVALVVNAYARLNIVNPVLFDYFADAVPARMSEYHLHSLCLIGAAYARQQHTAPRLFEAMGERIGQLSAELYPRAVASCVFSFAQLGVRHGPLLYHAPIHAERFASSYTCDELAMLAQSYAHLSINNTTLFQTILGQMHRFAMVAIDVSGTEDSSDYHGEKAFASQPQGEVKGSGAVRDGQEYVDAIARSEGTSEGRTAPPCRVVSLVWLLQAFAKLHIFDDQAFDILGDQLGLRVEELTPPMIAHVLYSFAQCTYFHPRALSAIVNHLQLHRASLHEFGQEELDLVRVSLIALGCSVDMTHQHSPEPVFTYRPPSHLQLATTDGAGEGAEVDAPVHMNFNVVLPSSVPHKRFQAQTIERPPFVLPDVGAAQGTGQGQQQHDANK
mmetsp:Transcript_33434/g.96607  ORF Transcript_33434/g.96607 Transcript_33434/m.96607 type:complete len:560 (+) Transcript_33434:3-1682(+)